MPVRPATRALFAVLAIPGLAGQPGEPGGVWAAIAPRTPPGAIMTLHAPVLDLAAWSACDTESLLACAGYVVIFAAPGIGWFR